MDMALSGRRDREVELAWVAMGVPSQVVPADVDRPDGNASAWRIGGIVGLMVVASLLVIGFASGW